MKRLPFMIGAATLPVAALEACHADPFGDGCSWGCQDVPISQLPAKRIYRAPSGVPLQWCDDAGKNGKWCFEWQPVSGKDVLKGGAGVTFNGASVGTIALEIDRNRGGIPIAFILTLECVSPDGIHHTATYDLIGDPWSNKSVVAFFKDWYWDFAADHLSGKLYNGNSLRGWASLDDANQVTHHSHYFGENFDQLVSYDVPYPVQYKARMGPAITLQCITAELNTLQRNRWSHAITLQ